MDPSEREPKKEGGHEKISPTAWGVAYRRTLSDIPYSKEVFDELQEIVRRTRSAEELAALESLRYAEVTPMFEARYKLVNRLLEENKTKQILEIAAGFSPRGIEMAQDPSVQYVALDLPGVTNEMRAILEKLAGQSKIPRQPNLHLEEGDATEAGDLERAAALFKQQPINVINEGLLRYLSFEEKTKVAQNIKTLLERFGGAWITPDISTRSLDSFGGDERMKRQNANVQRLTGIDLSGNFFESEEAAKKFFEDLGFSVEGRSFKEIAGELVSPQKLNLSPEQVEKMIGGRTVFVMRLRGEG